MLDPKLIMLDEPAGGINPTLIERMGDMIRELNATGTSLLSLSGSPTSVARLLLD